VGAETVRTEPAQGRLILGSSSPRRAQLLRRLGVEFTVAPVAIDEQSHVDGALVAYVAGRIARSKFDAIVAGLDGSPGPHRRVLTADTLVACKGAVLGKPASVDDAEQTLAAMSGQLLQIVTGVCLGIEHDDVTTISVETGVQLVELSAYEIGQYLATGEAFDKAGGLSLQGSARSFVAEVAGCWSNVIGLPLCAVAELLDLEPRGLGAHQRCSVELCGSHRQHEAD
jgi:septum formation protein